MNAGSTHIKPTPNPQQQQRAARLRQFNRRYVYAPLALGTIFILLTVGWLLWVGLSPETTASREFIGGAANMVIIMAIMPLLILCPILPAIVFYAIIHSRRSGSAPLRRLQTLFWQTGDFLAKAHGQIELAGNSLAGALIKQQARIAYGRQLLQSLIKRIVKR